jgi:hypothetical protein
MLFEDRGAHLAKAGFDGTAPFQALRNREPIMAIKTEPDATSTAQNSLAANPRKVRLQGGGLRFLDAWDIPQRDFNVVTREFQNNNT